MNNINEEVIITTDATTAAEALDSDLTRLYRDLLHPDSEAGKIIYRNLELHAYRAFLDVREAYGRWDKTEAAVRALHALGLAARYPSPEYFIKTSTELIERVRETGEQHFLYLLTILSASLAEELLDCEEQNAKALKAAGCDG